jgi:hypothetical protein
MGAAAVRRAVADRFVPAATGEIARTASTRASQRAVFGLVREMPEFSAHVVATNGQRRAMIIAAVLVIGTCILWPHIIAPAIVAGTSIGFISGLVFRIVLAWIGRTAPATDAANRDEGLPLYTVLVPLYHEASVLPQLIKNLAALDYPADRLDVKLIVEEDDSETRAVAQRLSPFDIVVVPPTRPRTKPKGCVPLAA